MTERRAAVDVGTNTVRLLVVDGDGRRLAREMTITRLGLGVERTGQLDPAALASTLATLERYQAIWRRLGVDRRVRIAATSAVRDATNRDRFFDGVRALTGVDAEVLSGEEEAALAFAGAAHRLPLAGPAALLDVGGGSTELVAGSSGGHVTAAVSLRLGSVRLTERWLVHDPPTPAEVAAATQEVTDRLEEAAAALGGSWPPTATLVGVAGTVTTLAALDLGLRTYLEDHIHGHRLPAVAVAAWSERLLGLTAAEIAELGPVQPGREDVLGAGVLIVRRVMERFGFELLVASEGDLLDGLVATLERSDPVT